MTKDITKYEGKILDLTNDLTFKKVFSDEHFKWYLSYIISYCTKINIDYIYNNIKYKNNFISSKNLKGKTGEADILVKVKDMVIDIEMNTSISEYLIRKNKYYVSALDSSNTRKSKTNIIKNKYIIQINISRKRRIPNANKLLYEIVQMDRNLKIEDVYNNHIIYDINLEYLENELYNKDKLTESEKGLLIFIEKNKEKLKEIFKGDEKMKKTVEDLSMLEIYKMDEEFYESYDHEEFRKIVEKQEREEEIREATVKSKEEGIAERNIEIAKNLIVMNIKVEDISKATGLSVEEISKIKEEINQEND